MISKPKVAIVGGVDIDGRLDLMRHLADDYEFCAIGSNSSLFEKFQAHGFPYEVYNLPRKVSPLSDLRAMFQLAQIFRRIKPDIVHTFDTKQGVWGSMAARMAAVPVIVATFTGLGSLYLTDDLKTRCLRQIYERLQRFASRFLDHAIFQNHDDARQFVDANIVPSEKVSVILGSGVSTDRFNVANISGEVHQDLRAELALERQCTVVTMVARLVRTKGVIEFMQAVEPVRAAYPNTRFLLIGPEDPESLDRLTPQELTELKLSVDVLGVRTDLPQLLSISDIFVLPSIREGIPRVLLEAAAMELPIITTDSPGCNEVVQDNSNGILIPSSDAGALTAALLKLIGDVHLREQFGKNSRRRAVEVFDISVVARQVGETYQRFFQSAGQASGTRDIVPGQNQSDK